MFRMADNSVLDNKRMFVIGSIRLSVSRHYLHDLQGKYMRVVVSLGKESRNWMPGLAD